MAVATIRTLLARGAVPLIYGDVALDDVRGCTIISTEQIMALLAAELGPQRIIVAGEVDGIYTADPQRDPSASRIPTIGPRNYAEVEVLLSPSFGIDVTGGMADKVRTLYALVTRRHGLTARIISGQEPGAVERALRDPSATLGTLVHGGE
jgi:isopentenyl phosphate kinase